jgi:hypothetical protein
LIAGDLARQVVKVFKILALGSDGQLEFLQNHETCLVWGKSMVGRSLESYVQLSTKLPLMEFYYLFLEEVFPRVKTLVKAEAYKEAISIVREAGARELERSGRAFLSNEVLEDWNAHVTKYINE